MMMMAADFILFIFIYLFGLNLCSDVLFIFRSILTPSIVWVRQLVYSFWFRVGEAVDRLSWLYKHNFREHRWERQWIIDSLLHQR